MLVQVTSYKEEATNTYLRQNEQLFCDQTNQNVKFFVDVLSPEQKRNHPACYQNTVQVFASLILWGCIKEHGQLTHLVRHYQCRQSFFHKRPCIFQEDNIKADCWTAKILHQTRMKHPPSQLQLVSSLQMFSGCLKEQGMFQGTKHSPALLFKHFFADIKFKIIFFFLNKLF